jgi:hypothetical protein
MLSFSLPQIYVLNFVVPVKQLPMIILISRQLSKQSPKCQKPILQYLRVAGPPNPQVTTTPNGV